MHFVDTMHSEAVTFTYIYLHSDAYDTVRIMTHSYAYIYSVHTYAFKRILCIHVLGEDPQQLGELGGLVRGAAHLLGHVGGDGSSRLA